MKNIIITTAVLLLATTNIFAADIAVSISPETAIVGEPVALTLTTDQRDYPRLLIKPQVNNLKWQNLGSSQSMSVVNGSVQTSTIYHFTVNEKGIYKIPPLKIMVGNMVITSKPITFRALSGDKVKVDSRNGSAAELKDVVFGKGIILAEGKDFYVGEEIPVEIRLYYLLRLGDRFQPTSWPDFNLDKVVFREYKNRNQRNNRFEEPTGGRVEIKGQLFKVIKFRTAFRPIAAGKLKPAATIKSIIKVPRSRQAPRRRSFFDEDFFGGFWGQSNYRQVPYTVNVKFPELTVKQLPTAPDGADYLGLVGNWHVSFELLSKEFKVGDPFTLKMEVTGLGTLETLTIPKLKIPGFRIYPPEVDKSSLTASGNQQAEVKYVLIPTQQGKKRLNLSVSVFSSPTEKYRIFKFNKEITVKKSDNTTDQAGPVYIAGQTAGDSGATSEMPEEKPRQQRRSGILYLKKSPSGELTVPLYDNWLWLYILLGTVGPLAWLLTDFRYARKKKFGSNPALVRRKAALSRRPAVLRALSKATPDDIDRAVQQEAVPYINDMLNLPPGTTPHELASKVKDQELAECLNSSGAASYMPGASNMDKQMLKKKIIKALKRFSIVMLLLVATQFTEAKKATVKHFPPATLSEALTAYDNGRFEAAADYFRKQLNRENPDASMLYNLGGSLCQMGDYAGSLVCLERAHLLAPLDSATTENLNYVRRKLFMPEVGKVRNPLELLIVARDSLRPDQWLLIVAAAWCAAWLALAIRRNISRNKLMVLLTFCGIAFGLGLTAVITEYRGPYNSARSIIVVNNTALRTLPSENSGRIELKMQSGAPVNVVELRQQWVRVKTNGTEGWVPKNAVISVAPGGRIP